MPAAMAARPRAFASSVGTNAVRRDFVVILESQDLFVSIDDTARVIDDI